MRNAIKALNKCAIYISALILCCLLLLITADVFFSNLFYVFIPGVFELTQLLTSMIVFLAIAYAYNNKKHVVSDVLCKVFPHSSKRIILSVSSSLLSLVTIGVVCRFILRLALGQISQGGSTMILNIPLWIASMIGALGMLLFALSVIGDLVLNIQNKEVL